MSREPNVHFLNAEQVLIDGSWEPK